MRRTLRQFRRQARTLLGRHAPFVALTLAGPMLFALVVIAAYSHGKVEALPVTIVDHDGSALSREITSAIAATEPFVIGQYAPSAEEFPRLAAQGRSAVCFVFPREMELDIKAGRGAQVAVLVDASNLILGNMAGTAATTLLATFSAGAEVRAMEKRGQGRESRLIRSAMPVAQSTQILFNPAFNSNYANFLVLGLVVIPVQLASLLAAVRLSARHTGVLALGLIPVCLVTVHLPAWLIGTPLLGSEWLLGALTVWFCVNLLAVGFAIARLVGDSLFAAEVCALLTMPNFILSGFTWPAFAMPRPMAVAASLLPMNPYAFALRKISLLGATVADLSRELSLLLAWSALAVVLLAVSSRKQGRA